jgi:hypothetical protein
MTKTLFSARTSGTDAAVVARRLLLFAMTAAMLTLTGCGDSGDDSEDDASHTGCHTVAADPGAPSLTCRTG